MLNKILIFFVLFAYINVIVYESDQVSVNGSSYLFDGDSVIEFILVDLMELAENENTVHVEIPNEDYRPFSHFQNLFPTILFILLAHCFKQILRTVKTEHPFYQAKSVFLPVYYRLLFRYKPF